MKLLNHPIVEEVTDLTRISNKMIDGMPEIIVEEVTDLTRISNQLSYLLSCKFVEEVTDLTRISNSIYSNMLTVELKK